MEMEWVAGLLVEGMMEQEAREAVVISAAVVLEAPGVAVSLIVVVPGKVKGEKMVVVVVAVHLTSSVHPTMPSIYLMDLPDSNTSLLRVN